MRSFTFTDTNGRKMRVWVRGWYQHKIRNSKELYAYKQRSADEKRAMGYDGWADAIERKTIMEWSVDSGIFGKTLMLRR